MNSKNTNCKFCNKSRPWIEVPKTGFVFLLFFFLAEERVLHCSIIHHPLSRCAARSIPKNTVMLWLCWLWNVRWYPLPWCDLNTWSHWACCWNMCLTWLWIGRSNLVQRPNWIRITITIMIVCSFVLVSCKWYYMIVLSPSFLMLLAFSPLFAGVLGKSIRLLNLA